MTAIWSPEPRMATGGPPGQATMHYSTNQIRQVAVLACLCVVATLLTMAPSTARANPAEPHLQDGDLLVSNHSFESGLDGWAVRSQGRHCGPDAASATHAAAHDGDLGLAIRTGERCRVVTVDSRHLDAQPEQEYRAFVRARGVDGAGAWSQLVFFDAQGSELGHGPRVRVSDPDWSSLRLEGTAPDGTASMGVRIRTDPSRQGSVHIDDVRVTAQWTNVGSQIHNAAVNASTHGLDADGRDTTYVVITGSMYSPAHLVGVLMDTGDVISDVELPGAWGAWNAVTAPDGSVIVGSYSNGHLYRYTPGDDAVVDLGQAIEGDSHVWDLRVDSNGTVYGGGYPSGGMFGWTADDGFHQVGPRPLVAGEDYVRAIGHDPELDLVYAGLGSHAHLMACDPQSTAACTDILPDSLREYAFAYNVSAGGGYLMLRMENGGQSVILQVTKASDGTVQAKQVADLGVVDYPGGTDLADGKFYYTKNGHLFSYDVSSATESDLNAATGIAARRWTVMELADQDGWPGSTVVGVNSGGVMVRYGIADQKLEITSSRDLPGAPVDINQMVTGPDEQIYTVGYLVGGMGIYDPMRGESTEHWPVGQAEGATVLGDKIYLGIYPKAKIQAYRPGQPVEHGVNPRQVCSLEEYDQDRPYAMAAGDDGKVYIGTMAAYGMLPGGLSVHDPSSGECEFIGHVVADQTIAALAWHDEMVYGGSLIWGGLGEEPAQEEAKFFRHDPTSGETRTYDLPVSGLRGVFGVTPGPDGNIWMVAENYLLIFDPETETWVHVSQPWKHIDYVDLPNGRITAFDAFLKVAPDGTVYGTIHGAEFFAIDPDSHEVSTLWTDGANHLTIDEFGTVYFNHHSTDLIRYAP